MTDKTISEMTSKIQASKRKLSLTARIEVVLTFIVICAIGYLIIGIFSASYANSPFSNLLIQAIVLWVLLSICLVSTILLGICFAIDALITWKIETYRLIIHDLSRGKQD